MRYLPLLGYPLSRRGKMNLTFNSQITVSDIASAVTALVAIFALVFAVVQVRESRRQRVAQMTQHVFEMLGSPESRESRRYLFNQIPEGVRVQDLTREQWSRIENIWVDFERVAQYIRHDLVDRDAILDTYAVTIIPTWARVAQYADYQAELRGCVGVFLTGFRDLADHAGRRWIEQNPGRELPRPVSMFPVGKLGKDG